MRLEMIASYIPVVEGGITATSTNHLWNAATHNSRKCTIHDRAVHQMADVVDRDFEKVSIVHLP